MSTPVKKHGEIELFPHRDSVDIFSDLVESIISQQLSEKAASTIFGRFKKLFPKGKISARNVSKLTEEDIRNVGTSYAKARYIIGLANDVHSGSLVLDSLHKQSDEDVMEKLTAVKGIGQWTAEMILMFTFHRPDVFSLGDAGLRRAISLLYKIEKDDDSAILSLSETWKPYRTYACRYLWKSLEQS